MMFQKFIKSDIWSADVKANVKQQQINYLVALSYKFLQEVCSYLQNLKYNVKRACIFIWF